MKDKTYRLIDSGGRFGTETVFADNLSYRDALQRFLEEKRLDAENKSYSQIHFEFWNGQEWVYLDFDPSPLIFKPRSNKNYFCLNHELKTNNVCSVQFELIFLTSKPWRVREYFSCFGIGEVYCENMSEKNFIQNDELHTFWRASSNFPFVLILHSYGLPKIQSLNVLDHIDDVFMLKNNENESRAI